MTDAVTLISNFKNDFSSNPEDFYGVAVAVSARDSKDLVDAVVLNDELRRSGFTNDLFIDMIPPSSVFHNMIANMNTDDNNFKQNSSKDFVYRYARIKRDLTDKDNLHSGIGRIIYSVVRIRADLGRNRVSSEDTGEVARITYSCRRKGRGLEEDPRVTIEIGEMGEQQDIDYFQDFPKNFEYQMKNNYTVALVVGRINKILQESFGAIPLRGRGGLYFIPQSQASTVCDYLMAMSVACPNNIRPILIPLSHNSGSSSREMIATSVYDELMDDFNKQFETWQNSLEEVKNGDRKRFHSSNVIDSLINMEVMKKRVLELEKSLEFDFSRIKMVQEDISDLIKEARKHAAE